MGRRLWLVVIGCGGLSAAALSVWYVARPRPTPPAPRAVHFAEVPKALYRSGEYKGESVRVAFTHALTPTADPLVFHFHPGDPPEVAPETFELHFAERPALPATLPVVVVGTVSHLRPDLVIRTNGVPGRVVLTGCYVAPPASP